MQAAKAQQPEPVGQRGLDRRARACYRRAMTALNMAGAPYLVGGAYALEQYTGIARHTKDFDIFVHPASVQPTLAILAGAGFRTELTFRHWLGKAFRGDDLVDVIFSSGNGIGVVDDEWFAHAAPAEVLGIPVLLCPPEEMIWQKAFIMEKERFDGADIAHLLRARAATLDWSRLLRRFDRHRRVLLVHLILFGYIYPAERDLIPAPVLAELLDDLQAERRTPPPTARLCQGTFLSLLQYLVDIERDGYQDARLAHGYMSEADLAAWTAAFLRDC
ncbi:MAG: nucleotidyltransferase family protein [Thermomicrobiales bacterium]